jgi:hypothetical protein
LKITSNKICFTRTLLTNRIKRVKLTITKTILVMMTVIRVVMTVMR